MGAAVFTGMHQKIAAVYGTCCDHTTQRSVKLSVDTKKINKVKSAFDAALQYLHEKGSFNSADLNSRAIKNLTDATYAALKSAIGGIETEIPATMLHKLQNDVFLFSGMKTYAQLKEASLLLRDATGNIKSATSFIHDVQKINSAYNEHYLRAEHQYAVSASETAAQWAEWEKTGDRYNLQFRTAADDKVRHSHAVLHNITLPMSHPFWRKYITPLDWGCRCRVIQVLKSKYEVSDGDAAMKAAASATPEIFRYNPGKDSVIFPPKHPYYLLSKEAAKVLKDQLPHKEDKKETTDPVSSNEGAIDLSKYIKGDKITNKAVKNILQEYASQYTENFSTGLEDVSMRKSRSYLMQHSAKVNTITGQRTSKSTINISTADFRDGFNPARDLMEGLVSIKNKKPLTFNQEYAFESLWHEILHAKTQTKYYRLSALQREHMETVNQFVARHTYPDFIKAFGGQAEHQAEILDKGYGYGTWISNFRKKLAEKGIDEARAVEFLTPHLMKDYSNLGSKMRELLSSNEVKPE
jgi:hypothetical protein